MASQLEDKVQYGLLNSGFSGADKTILQFKLTDSSLKSIEEYLLAKVGFCNLKAVFSGLTCHVLYYTKQYMVTLCLVYASQLVMKIK